MDGEVGQAMKDLVTDKGFVALDYWDNGFKHFSSNQKALIMPEDAKGQKFRIMSSKVIEAQFLAVGANPQVLPFSEVYSALQQGVVDGLEGTVDAYGSNGSSEVAKNMALTNHFLGVCGVYINNDVFNAMPLEYQKIVQEEFTKGAKQMVGEISNNYDKQVAALEAQGITFNEVDHDAFAKAVEPVFKSLDGIDDDVVSKIKAEIAKMPK